MVKLGSLQLSIFPAKSLSALVVVLLGLVSCAKSDQPSGQDTKPAAADQNSGKQTKPSIETKLGSCNDLVTQEQIDQFLRYNKIESIVYLTGSEPVLCRRSVDSSEDTQAFKKIVITPAFRENGYTIIKNEYEKDELLQFPDPISYQFSLEQIEVSKADLEEIATTLKMTSDLSNRIEVVSPEWIGLNVGELPDILVAYSDEVQANNSRNTFILSQIHKDANGVVQGELDAFKAERTKIRFLARTQHDSKTLIAFDVKAGEKLSNRTLKFVTAENFIFDSWARIANYQAQFGRMEMPSFLASLRKTMKLRPYVSMSNKDLKSKLFNPFSTAHVALSDSWRTYKISASMRLLLLDFSLSIEPNEFRKKIADTYKKIRFFSPPGVTGDQIAIEHALELVHDYNIPDLELDLAISKAASLSWPYGGKLDLNGKTKLHYVAGIMHTSKYNSDIEFEVLDLFQWALEKGLNRLPSISSRLWEKRGSVFYAGNQYNNAVIENIMVQSLKIQADCNYLDEYMKADNLKRRIQKLKDLFRVAVSDNSVIKDKQREYDVLGDAVFMRPLTWDQIDVLHQAVLISASIQFPDGPSLTALRFLKKSEFNLDKYGVFSFLYVWLVKEKQISPVLAESKAVKFTAGLFLTDSQLKKMADGFEAEFRKLQTIPNHSVLEFLKDVLGANSSDQLEKANE